MNQTDENNEAIEVEWQNSIAIIKMPELYWTGTWGAMLDLVRDGTLKDAHDIIVDFSKEIEILLDIQKISEEYPSTLIIPGTMFQEEKNKRRNKHSGLHTRRQVAARLAGLCAVRSGLYEERYALRRRWPRQPGVAARRQGQDRAVVGSPRYRAGRIRSAARY